MSVLFSWKAMTELRNE